VETDKTVTEMAPELIKALVTPNVSDNSNCEHFRGCIRATTARWHTYWLPQLHSYVPCSWGATPITRGNVL